MGCPLLAYPGNVVCMPRHYFSFFEQRICMLPRQTCPERNQRSVKSMTPTVQLILVALSSEQQLTLAVGCIWFCLVALWVCFSGFVAHHQFQNLKKKPMSTAGARSIWVEMLLCEIPEHHWHEVTLPAYFKLDTVASIFNLLLQVFTVFFQSEEVKLPSYVSTMWTVSGSRRQVSTPKASGRSASCCLSLHLHSLLAVKPTMQCRMHLRHRSKS